MVTQNYKNKKQPFTCMTVQNAPFEKHIDTFYPAAIRLTLSALSTDSIEVAFWSTLLHFLDAEASMFDLNICGTPSLQSKCTHLYQALNCLPSVSTFLILDFLAKLLLLTSFQPLGYSATAGWHGDSFEAISTPRWFQRVGNEIRMHHGTCDG